MRTIDTGDGRTTITSPFMNLAEAAIYCRCSDDVLTRAVADRLVTYYQPDAQTLIFSRDGLDAYLKNYEVLSRDNYDGDPPDDAPPDLT